MNESLYKDFIPYKEALALKELGFNEKCLGHYQDNIEMFTHKHIKGKLNLGFLGQCKSEPYDWNNTPKWGSKIQKFYSAPTYAQAFRWFREKYKLRFFISSHLCDLGEFFKVIIPSSINLNESCDSYEEAELKCLKKLIQIVKSNNEKEKVNVTVPTWADNPGIIEAKKEAKKRIKKAKKIKFKYKK